jgi:hypothetical protein
VVAATVVEVVRDTVVKAGVVMEVGVGMGSAAAKEEVEEKEAVERVVAGATGFARAQKPGA